MSNVSDSPPSEESRRPAMWRSVGLPARVAIHGPRWIAAVLLVTAALPARSADAAERKFIRAGMGEGEVVLKIGKPDHEAFIRVVKGEPEEKTWTYFPHPRDAQTLTIVSLKAGVVTRVDRKIAR